MRILKKLLLGVAAFAVLLVVAGFFLPRTAHVERHVQIKAPPSTVFTVLNGFRQFPRWSPWQHADPDMSVTFSGPPMGVGAALSWSGNASVGTGRQEIIESEPYRRILMRLEFGDFGGQFLAPFTVEPIAGGTQLTWGFDADYGSNILGRYFGLLSDRMLGPDYETGLARLKALVESLPPEDFSRLDVTVVEAKAEPFVFVSGRSALESRALGVALGVAYSKVSGFLSAHGVEPSGAALAVFHGEQEGLLYFDAGLALGDATVAPAGEIRIGLTPAGSAVRAVWRGEDAELPAAHRQLKAYLAAAGLEQAGPSWERYPGGPAAVANPERVTEIFAAVK